MTDHRRCEKCGGAMPNRTHRQRNQKGQLVCDSCADRLAPSWGSTQILPLEVRVEMARREAQALDSILRTSRLRSEAHDSGDQALIHHCPFCGSGSVTGRSDGSAECDFCNSVFTVQVQPAHPNMPQTIDGNPVTPPGMPGGEETELSGTDDPTVAESEDGVAANSLDDEDPTAPKGGKPNPFAKGDAKDKTDAKDPQAGDNPVDKAKKKSQPPWLKSKSSRPEDLPGLRLFRTASGATLDADAYMAHLALEATKGTPAHEAVLDTVRVANLSRQAARVKCPDCGDREKVVVNGRTMVKPKVDGAPPYVCGTCNGTGRIGEVGAKQASHPDFPHGVPYECPTCGNYRTKDHCDTCADNATYRKQRGPTFLDYLMHGLAPSGATASKTALVVVCPECNGSGVDDQGETCWYCEGDGTVDEGSYGETGVR